MKTLQKLICALVLASPMIAQLLLGNLSGTVKDVQGGAIGGTEITVENVDTNLKVTAATQSNGTYSVQNLPIGTYRVTVAQKGFQTKIFSPILVQGNRTTTVDAELAVSTTSAVVEVTGTPLRNETDPTNGYVLDSHTIQSTPLGTGSFTQLAILSPGVNADLLSGSGTNTGIGNQNIWANGQRDTSNTFTMNGVNANNLFNGKSSSQVSESRFVLNTGQNSIQHAGGTTQTSTSVYDAIGQGLPTPAPETIEEIRVNTSQYDTSQGGTSGAQVAVITKSGTNQFHGQLYDYFQNNDMNAADFFRNSDSSIPQSDKVAALHYNRFGATLGGPILRNKLFFFASYQGVRDSDMLNSISYSTVPQHLTDDRSAAALVSVAKQDFGVNITPSQISPVAAALLNYKVNGNYLIPSVTVASASQAARLGYNTFISGPPTTANQDQGNANVDWNASDKDRLSVKYFGSENPTVAPFAQSSTYGFSQSLEAGSQVASIDNTYIISPSFTWEQRVGFIRQKAYATTAQSLTPQDVGINLFGSTNFPSLTIYQADGALRNSFVIGPKNNFGNAGVYQNRGSWGSTANWVVGRHTLTFGFDMSYTQLNVINQQNNVATLESQTFSDFLQGTPLNNQYSYIFAGASNRYYHAWQAGAFVQDNYKLKSNLTISLGFRYDYNGPFSEKYGNLANFYSNMYQYNASTDTVVDSGIVVAGNNKTLGTKGVNDSTITGNQFGFSPRVGIAWSPSFVKNLTVRAGFGIYYDRGEYFTYLSPGAGRGFSGPFGVTLQLPFVSQLAASSTGTLSQPFGSTPPPPPNNPDAITALLPNIAGITKGNATYLFGGYDSANVLPYTENWSFDLQWQAKDSWLFTLGYVGNHGVHQVLPLPANQPLVATPSNPINGQQYSYGFNMIPTETLKTYDGGNTDLRVPYLGYSTNNILYQTVGVSSYNSLQVGVRKRLSYGLQLTASYTYSHSLDEQSGLGLFYNGNDPTNTHLSYGNSSYDRTHVFITSYLYQLPNAIKSQSWVRHLTNDWQLNGVITAESGQPFNMYDYSGAVAGQYYSNQVSILDPIVGFTPGLTNSQVTKQGTTGVNVNNPYIDATKLYVPTIAPGTNGVPPCVVSNGQQMCDLVETGFANSGRNVFRAPFQSRWDFSVGKNFNLTERFRLRYQADFFNILNHPSFDAPNNSTSMYSVSSGKVTVRAPSSSAGFISHTLGSPRFIQMSLRLEF